MIDPTPTAVESSYTFKKVKLSGTSNYAVWCGITTADKIRCSGNPMEPEYLGRDSNSPLTDSATTYLDLATSSTLCGITTQNTLKCWGGPRAGIEANAPSPLKIGIIKYKDVQVSGSLSCAQTMDNRVQCWGLTENTEGTLGVGKSLRVSSPQAIPKLGDVSEFTTGFDPGNNSGKYYHHGCALLPNGEIKCWGRPTSGILVEHLPKKISDLKFKKISKFGYSHTCAIGTNDKTYCWGLNTNGQLGDGTTTTKTAPVIVQGEDQFTMIAGGLNHTCGLTAAGKIKCWGHNNFGQLGTGNTTPSSLPVTVPGNENFKSVSAGSNHTCGIVQSGEAYCWGRNASWQLGIPDAATTANVLSPTLALQGNKVIKIQPSHEKTCAVTLGNEIFCWGIQVGKTPTLMGAGHVWKHVAFNTTVTCGINTDDELHCWGAAAHSQLGQGDHYLYPSVVY